MGIVRAISAVDLHAGGEPGRVLMSSTFSVPGNTMYEKMQRFRELHDDVRLLLLREPRGYPAANCIAVLPPCDPSAAAGFIMMEQTEYPLMAGTSAICVATALIGTGAIAVTEPVTEFFLESPAGLLAIRADVREGRAERITFENVPAFVFALDAVVEVPEIGTLNVDLAYGGMIYAIVDGSALGLRLSKDEGRDIARIGEMIKIAAREQHPVAHPENPGMMGPTVTLLSGPPSGTHADLRNVVVVSSGELDWAERGTWTGAIDRSPCGTGTSAKMATMYARGTLALGVEFRHEGILGTVFTGRLLRETMVAGLPAVVPSISGSAWLTGFAHYVLEGDDPFPTGFTVGDIWGRFEHYP